LTHNRVQVHQKKNQIQQGVTRTDNCLVTSHSTILTVVRISPTQFCIWQKTGCGIRSFVLRDGKLDVVVETLPKLFMWAKFYWSRDFQRITM